MAVMILITGFIFIGVSVHVLRQNKNIMKTGKRTTAVVIRTEQGRVGGGRNAKTYIPIVEYTIDGVRYEKAHPVGNISPKYKDGTTFEIMYDKGHPNKIVFVDDKTQTVVAIILIANGLLFLGIALSQFLS